MNDFNFHNKYNNYKATLSLFILEKISKTIKKKYQLNEENEYIDSIFEKYKTQYKRKKAYDKQFYSKVKNSTNNNI